MENISLFNKIKDDGVEEILANVDGEPQVFAKDEIIWKQGGNISKVAIVLVGEVKIYTKNLDNTETIINYAHAGETFGLNYICAGIKTSPVTVKAEKQTGVLFLSYEKMLKSCSGSQSWQIKLLKNMFEAVTGDNLRLSDRVEVLDKRTLREKIMTYLNKYALKSGSKTFEIPLNREQMAEYLCVDRSALSRELSNLRNEKIIDFNKNQFSLH